MPQSRLRYQDVLDQIAAGQLWSVYIDDTGPGGKSASPETLPADRQTHVAVVFPAVPGVVLMEQMPGVLAKLHEIAGTTEFHFTDIYNGKGGYRKLKPETRLCLFDLFAQIVVDHQLTFIVQSLDSRNSANIFDAFGKGFEQLKAAFDVTEGKDLSLLLLLLQIRRHLDKTMPKETRAAIFVDEGWKSNGVGVLLPTFEQHFLHSAVLSARSVDIPGLQFADFGAFVLNRSQLLLGRSSLSKMDMRMIDVWQRIGPRFINIVGWPLEVHEAGDGKYRLVQPPRDQDE